MKITTRTVAALAAGALLAGSALADIRIGVLMPLSGKGASYGQHQEVAMKMAQQELEKGGIKGEKVQFIVYDTRGENAEAISLTRKLIHNDKVLAIIGPFFSAETEVAFPVGVQGKTPIITASAAKPGIATKNRPWAFRNALASDQMNGLLIDSWLKQNPNVKSVVILTDVKDAFTKVDGQTVFPAILQAKGIKVLDNISFQTADIDYAAQVTRTKQLNPDGIVVAGLYNEGGNIVREIRKQGLKQPVVGALGMSEPKFLDIAGPASEGTMVVMPFWPDNPEPRIASWVNEYKKRANVAPNNTDALMYDTVFMLKNCIETTGVTNKEADLAGDREKIRGCLEKIKFNGVAGPIRFNENGDAVLQPTVLQARGGKWSYLR
ncbi:ABC transporter substrate-binding protein [Ramlibacter henchirensis]|jgi:branched-chain amino acid transport system substrate-binding protein|nr:ABC transporter substrate-binding protein [Ramlibacter henchirensis]